MGRVSLLVEANTSDAISKISGLGEAIKKAMSGFDSSKLATWEQSLDKQLQSVKGKLNDLKEKLKGLTNDFKAEVPFGANNSISTFKDRLKSADEALKTFKATFKDGYTFGAVAQIDSLKSKLNEAQKAIAALNAEAGKSTNLGANQNAKAKKDEITKTIAAVEQLNRSLAKKPVIGAAEAVRSLEQALQKLSANVPNYLSPISFSLNALKTQMLELSQVLNSVQQPTWVEPFKTKMQEVVKVLQDIATAYKSVKTEIKQPVGESAARREFQMTDKQAQNLYRTTKMFYRHVRQEFKETRAAATETARAIREAMAAVQGGGTGAGGTGTATAGTRLGFGEQLFSRMRSNLYSYLTMWFGVAGAIRAANAILEKHNELLEKGKELSQTKFDYLGQLRLKAGANAPEYEAMAERVMKKGMEKNAAYQFAGFAAMSNISAKEAESIAPYFINRIASANDQRALLSAVAYARANGYSDYSTEQIMAMFLEANKNNPSELAPTANALIRNLRTNRLFGISLEEQMALTSLGGAEQKDANAATIQRALLSKIYSEGLAPLILGEIEGVGYYKDEVTQKYKFKDAARQAQFEEDMRSGNQVLTVEMIAQVADRMGDQFTKLIGKRLQANLGASFYADISQDPTRFNEIYASMQAIGGGDLTAARSVLKSVSEDPSVKAQVSKIQAENFAAISKERRANFYTQLEAMQTAYGSEAGGYNGILGALNIFTDWKQGFFPLQTAAIKEQSERLSEVLHREDLSDEFKQKFKADFENLIESYILERLGNRELNTRKEQFEAVREILVKLDDAMRSKGDIGIASNFRVEPSADLYTDIIFGNEIKDTPIPTGAVKAVRAAGSVTYTNKWEEEERHRKQEEKDAKAEAKAAKAEAKAEKDKAKADAKAEWDSIMGTAVKPQKNIFLQDVFGVASSDMDSNLQAVKGAALNDKWSTGKTGGILGQAFYAYASDKTNAATDKKIIEQLVATLNQGGMSIDDMGNLVVKYVNSVGGQTDSEEARKTLLTFMKEVTGYLKNISDGSDVIQTPIVNQPKR